MRKKVVFMCILFLYSLVGSAQEKDKYGGFLDIKGEKTGFFHTEKIDSRWWLITPDGNGFFGLGISHPTTSRSEGAVLFAYNKSQEKWIGDGVDIMKNLGYNCVWTGPYTSDRNRDGFIDTELAEKIYKEKKIAYAVQIPLIRHQVEIPKGEIRRDVFGKEYKAFVRKKVTDIAGKYKNDPWVMGYFYGFGSFMNDYMWINETIAYPAGSNGRTHLINTLQKIYEDDIAEFNKVYSSNYKSFKDVQSNGIIEYPRWITTGKSNASQIPETAEAKQMMADARILLKEIALQIYKLAYDEIRRVDENHMCFGGYVKHTTYDLDTWKVLAPYIDIATPQDFSTIVPAKDIAEVTGLPILISDQVFGNVYPDELLDKGAPGAVPHEFDRRVLYKKFSDRISCDPIFVGISYCACIHDQTHWGSTYDYGQRGFYDIFGTEKEDLCNTARKCNHEAHTNTFKVFPESEIEAYDKSVHKTWESYRMIMNERKKVRQEY